MRKLMLLAVPAAFACLALAADPAGFHLWSAGELKKTEKALGPKIDAGKVATESLAKFDNHSIMLAHREGSGQAELHAKTVDVFVVQSGEATLVVGGTMPGDKSTGPGERRGPSINGGTKHKLTTGDIVHIPANTPHQLLLDASKQFTYFVVKVEEK